MKKLGSFHGETVRQQKMIIANQYLVTFGTNFNICILLANFYF